MPRGTRHVETGTLRRGRWGYELEVDGGGVWRLDVIRFTSKLLGQRVIVEGIRSDFDLLDVTAIRAIDGMAGDRRWWMKIVARFQRLQSRKAREAFAKTGEKSHSSPDLS